jgi:hypothetical protein
VGDNVAIYLELLSKQFGGQHLISIKQAAAPLGLTVGTASNRASLGTFPVPIVHDGGRKKVRLIDLARYLCGETEKRGRGRPRKAEQIARRAAGGAQ